MANIADPEGTTCYEQYHLDLHCLQRQIANPVLIQKIGGKKKRKKDRILSKKKQQIFSQKKKKKKKKKKIRSFMHILGQNIGTL